MSTTAARGFLGITEAAWRLLLVGGVVALWFLVVLTGTAHADDCLEYVKNAKNFVTIPRGLLEDCMRTGVVQALVTSAVAGIGGATIAAAITKAIQDAAAKAGRGPHIAPDLGQGATTATPKASTSFAVLECVECGAPLPDTVTPGALCPACRYQNPTTVTGRCPNCRKMINREDGNCPACRATFPPAPKVIPPPDPTVATPKANTRFAGVVCIGCGEWLPDTVSPGALCPACRVQNPIAVTGRCLNCHTVINLESGYCPACRATFRPPEPRRCLACGRELLGELPPDGRCPACGARVPSAQTSSTQSAGGSSGPAGTAPAAADAGSQQTGSPTPPIPGGGKAPAGGAAAGVAPPAPAPGAPTAEPAFVNQGVIKGDQAADLLQQAGLAKVTRDPSGKPIKVEEAFPGAFTNLGGPTVTIRTGESSGGGSGPDWVEEAKGRITGIGFKPGPDGTLGEPVIVVNQSDSQWRQLPPDPFNAAIQAAKDAAAQIGQAVTDAANKVQQEYRELRSNVGLVDTARAAYTITKAMDPKKANAAVADLAKQLKIDLDLARQVLDMDEKTWKGIQAGINLPGTIVGN